MYMPMLLCLLSIGSSTVQEPVSSALGLKPAKAYETGYLAAAEIKAKHEYELEHGIKFPKLVRGNPRRKELAITFDDGPHPDFTPRLLQILGQHDIRATFFVIGKMVDLHPELVQQQAAAGHEVANHTYDHLRLPFLTDKDIEAELNRCARAIERAIGSSGRVFRPPGGEYDADVTNVARRGGYVMTLWTDDPADFANPGAQLIEKRVLKQISNGGILLLHDGSQQTIDILPDLLQRLKAKG